jgi:hypothetical protein
MTITQRPIGWIGVLAAAGALLLAPASLADDPVLPVPPPPCGGFDHPQPCPGSPGGPPMPPGPPAGTFQGCNGNGFRQNPDGTYTRCF